ncbi:MAG: excinuclease ABC subunit UvrC [Elusimicrobiaceae bacterium]|nr:excinuclease ABC subunit UvrC [Elusimicrobiaceae bacterium]
MDERINILPHSPGVYVMRAKDGTILYIGKAKNLAERVKQYFQESNLYSRGWKLPSLLPLIAKIDYVACSSERDALVLEEKLIKQYQPFFNSLGKDGKTYPYLKLSLSEDFPRLQLVRKSAAEAGKNSADAYYGPYPKSYIIKNLMHFLWRSQYAPLRLCKWKFSRGNKLAAQKINTCIYYHTGQCPAPCAGKISYEDYQKNARRMAEFLDGNFGNLQSTLEKLMKLHSDHLEYEQAAVYRNFLHALDHMKERVLVGRFKDDYITTALENTDKLKRLAEVIGLKKLPTHIEAFDNSHLFGREAVGCMVCFINGEKNHEHYRRFKIRSKLPEKGGSDFAMMEESVYRRLRQLKRDPAQTPDLILLDGGKSQIHAALNAYERAGMYIPFIALAETHEGIYLPGAKESIKLPIGDPALNLLMEIRDEVHRFAITYHRKLRDKAQLQGHQTDFKKGPRK